MVVLHRKAVPNTNSCVTFTDKNSICIGMSVCNFICRLGFFSSSLNHSDHCRLLITFAFTPIHSCLLLIIPTRLYSSLQISLQIWYYFSAEVLGSVTTDVRIFRMDSYKSFEILLCFLCHNSNFPRCSNLYICISSSASNAGL